MPCLLASVKRWLSRGVRVELEEGVGSGRKATIECGPWLRLSQVSCMAPGRQLICSWTQSAWSLLSCLCVRRPLTGRGHSRGEETSGKRQWWGRVVCSQAYLPTNSELCRDSNLATIKSKITFPYNDIKNKGNKTYTSPLLCFPALCYDHCACLLRLPAWGEIQHDSRHLVQTVHSIRIMLAA